MLCFLELISQPSSYTCCYLSLQSKLKCISHFPAHFSYLESSSYLSDSTHWGKGFACSQGTLTGKAQLPRLILAAAEPSKLRGLAFFPFLSLTGTGTREHLKLTISWLYLHD